MAAIRLFVAVHLSAEVRAAMEKALDHLRKIPADVKWVRPEAMHLTLKFIGSVGEERLTEVQSVIADSLRDRRLTSLRFQGVGTFGPPKMPKIVWAGGHEAAGTLRAIHESLEVAMTRFGSERETRPFSPHVTLGRVQGRRGSDELLRAVEKHKADPFGSFEVREVALVQSDLRPEGSQYTTRSTLPLESGDA